MTFAASGLASSATISWVSVKQAHPARFHRKTRLPVPLTYLFPVLQTLQHRQVVVPRVFRAKPGQVLPAHPFLGQLPAGGAPPRQRGPGSRDPRCRPRTSGRLQRKISISCDFGDNVILSSNWVQRGEDADREQEKRNTYTVRHLHGSSQPAAAFRGRGRNEHNEQSCRRFFFLLPRMAMDSS